MKVINLLKSIPLLLILSILIISNKKENTKLKILIWNTPSLSVGTYVAISMCTGFILSYSLTNNLANKNQTKIKPEIKYKTKTKTIEYNTQNDTNKQIKYDNTYIERDIKDPSPTINASFRVISKRNNNNYHHNNMYKNVEEKLDFEGEREYQSYDHAFNAKSENDLNLISNDWEDKSYLNW